MPDDDPVPRLRHAIREIDAALGGTLVLMRAMCVVIFWAFMAVRPAPAHAEQIDLLIVLLQDKHGKSTIHQVNLKKSADCPAMVAKFQKQAQNGEPVMLTIEAPPKVTGRILAAYCILPDGSKIGGHLLPPS